MLPVPAMEHLHHPRHRTQLRRCRQQVHMVVHEYIRVNRTVISQGRRSQVLEIVEPGLHKGKARHAVSATQYDMLRHIRRV